MVNPALEPPVSPLSDRAMLWPRFRPLPARSQRTARAAGIAGLSQPRAAQVHLWAAALDAPDSVRAAYQGMLNSSEQERAKRFLFEKLRHRYIVAHGWLRQLLGSYLDCLAHEVEFELGTNGKPSLAGAAKASGLQFNLAHSDNLCLIAITHGVAVGVDVERLRHLDDAEDLVTRFFSEAEARTFKSLPQAERTAAFFNLWTRKEAWLKATGEGIAYLLSQVEVSLLPGEPARLLQLPPGFADQSAWSLGHLNPATGYVGAYAMALPGAQVECRCWDHAAQAFDL